MTTYYISAFGNANDSLGDTLEWILDSSNKKGTLSFSGIPGETNNLSSNDRSDYPKELLTNTTGSTWRCILLAPTYPSSTTNYSLAGTVVIKSGSTYQSVYFCAFSAGQDPYTPPPPNALAPNDSYCSYLIRVGENSDLNRNPFLTGNRIKRYLAPSSTQPTYFDFLKGNTSRLRIVRDIEPGEMICLYMQNCRECPNPWGNDWPIPNTWRATWTEPKSNKTFILVFVELASKTDSSGQIVGLVQNLADEPGTDEVTGVFGAEYP